MSGIDQYKSVHAATTSPHELIQMLLDKYIVRVDQAIEATNEKNIEKKSIAISKSIEILGALEESLNIEKGGELAENLRNLYEYSRGCLVKSSTIHNVSHLIEAKELIEQVRDGWSAIPEPYRSMDKF